MQNQNISSSYLSKCDLINRMLVKDVNEIPNIDKIVIHLSSSQNKKTENSISTSDLNSQLKILLMFYFMLGINPKVTYHREKNLNYQAEEKENDSAYSYKIVLENTLDIQKFLHHFFVENNFRKDNLSSNIKFSISNEEVVSLKLTVPTFLDSDIENIFSVNSKESSIKDLTFSANFIVNSRTGLKTSVKGDLYSIYPFWFLS
jgi:hypothetical protein